MSDIDPEKLKAALYVCGAETLGGEDGPVVVPASYLRVLAAAARFTLATLSRRREVELNHWAVVHADGTIDSLWDSRESADTHAQTTGYLRTVGRVTGTVTVHT